MKRLTIVALVCFAAGSAAGLLAARSLTEVQAAAQPGKEPADRPAAPPDDGKLRIICFGAHPDDCELKAGGVVAMWAAQGHHVKFVSTTNGDIGHWREAGGPLAKRRKSEVERAAKILGIATEVMGASFRNVGQILALAGSDLLTISPELLAQLAASELPVLRALDRDEALGAEIEPVQYDEKGFCWARNEDVMASEKLAEGIRTFAVDAVKLEKLIRAA